MLRSLIVVVVALVGCGIHPTGPDSAMSGDQLARALLRANVLETGDTVEIIAHRGFACCYPENTLTAIRAAYALGAKAVEVDVRMTGDGVPILMHDATVDRTTNGRGAVHRLTFSQLRVLDACSWFGRGASRCQVPTLGEALYEAKNASGRLLVELKMPFSREEIEIVLAEIYDAGMQNQVEILSFDPRIVRIVRELDAEIPVSLVTMERVNVDWLHKLGNAAVDFSKELIQAHPDIVRTAREQGIHVGGFTVHRLDEARMLVSRGVTRIMTDIPVSRPLDWDQEIGGDDELDRHRMCHEEECQHR